jgi:hypothetical protein
MGSRHGAEREVSRTTDGGERRTTCASCGRQVAPGARYCIHCGAEQSLPTPIAAVAAAMARGRPREAANAAHAEPARTVLSDASRVDAPPAAPTLTRTATADAANSPPPTPPAYDAGPSRMRLAAGLVASLVAVAIALAAIAWWRGEHDAGEANATATPASTAQTAAPGLAPAESASASAGEATSATTPSLASAPAANPTSGSAGSATGLPSAAATPDAAVAPVEIKVLPPHPQAGRTQRRSAAERAGSATAPVPPTPPATEASAAAPAPVAQAKSVAPAPPARRVSDRWQRLDDELSRCTREDFISRVVCGQRVRFRYCDGYWGKVAQCPGNPLPDHGQ